MTLQPRTPTFRQHTKNTMPCPRTTIARRSCSTPSCRQNRGSRRRRLASCVALRSMTLHRTRCRKPAPTIAWFRITPTTRSVMSTMCPPRRHSGSQPRRRSTRPSISRRGTTLSARRFPPSTCRPKTRAPNRWRTPQDRNPLIQPPRKQAMQRFATSAPARRPGPSISTTRTTRNRRLPSTAPHRSTCRKALPMRTPV